MARDHGHDPYWLEYLATNTTRPPVPTLGDRVGASEADDRQSGIARLADQRLLVLGCDYRGPQDGQGCNCRNVCFARKGPIDPVLVSYGDCVRCVQGG